MRAVEWLAEQRILEAVEQGAFDDLAGAATPRRWSRDKGLTPGAGFGTNNEQPTGPGMARAALDLPRIMHLGWRV
jgi:hypothetical protein